MKIGSDNIGSLFLGTKEFGKAYLGTELVHGEELPYDAKIEYIQSTGTQYIDTGFKMSSNIRTEIKAQFLQNHDSWDTLLGCSIPNSGGNGMFVALNPSTGSNSNKLYLDIGQTINGNAGWLSPSSALPFAMHTFVSEINGSTISFTIDGTPLTGNWYGVYPTELSLYIFGRNFGGEAARFATAKVCYCKIWQGGNLVFDAYPVRVGSVGYLYDTISGQLFGNAGSGSFILGNDLTT